MNSLNLNFTKHYRQKPGNLTPAISKIKYVNNIFTSFKIYAQYQISSFGFKTR